MRVTDGNWKRFERYKIRDGYIRADLESDLQLVNPWSEHDSAWEGNQPTDAGAKRVVTPPYQSLLDLVNNLTPSAMFEPSPEECEAIVGWCSEHGLLGLLPHALLSVEFAPVWVNDPDLKRLIPASRTWTRKPNGWTSRAKPHQVLDGNAIWTMDEELLGQPVSPEHLPALLNPSGAHCTKPGAFEVSFKPVGQALDRYFPDLAPSARKSFNYPTPLSDPFWREYAEPVAEFVSAAVQFSNAVKDLASLSGPLADLDPARASRLVRSQTTLNALATGTQQFLGVWQGGGFVQRWVSTSLLSSLATMTVQALAAQEIRLCASCGKAFSTSAYQSKYCSTRCRDREIKRRYRSKKSQGKKSKSKK